MTVARGVRRVPDMILGFRRATNLTANVWHAIEPVSSGVVEITVPASSQCPAYVRSPGRAIEAYYRPRVGFDVDADSAA